MMCLFTPSTVDIANLLRVCFNTSLVQMLFASCKLNLLLHIVSDRWRERTVTILESATRSGRYCTPFPRYCPTICTAVWYLFCVPLCLWGRHHDEFRSWARNKQTEPLPILLPTWNFRGDHSNGCVYNQTRNFILSHSHDRLCGLVVRVPGC
jgi:hypothetical protein